MSSRSAEDAEGGIDLMRWSPWRSVTGSLAVTDEAVIETAALVEELKLRLPLRDRGVLCAHRT